MSRILVFAMVVSYIRGAMENMGLSELLSKLVCEIPIVILAVVALCRSRKSLAPGWGFVMSFVAVSLCSGVVSGDGILTGVLYCRMFVYSYVVLWYVWESHVSRAHVRQMVCLILCLWVVQIPTSLFFLVILKERVEANVGAITAATGSPGTVFPLLAMGALMSMYCYYRRKAWIVPLALSFTIVGYTSGKRAIYFYMPLLYGGVLLWYSARERSFTSIRSFVLPLAIILMTPPLYFRALNSSKGISSAIGGNTTIEIIASMLQYAEKYEKRENEGYASGRLSTSSLVLRRMLDGDIELQVFGLGPGALMREQKAKEIMHFSYGQTGFLTDLISVGIVGMLSQCGFYLYLGWLVWRQRFASVNNFARALQLAIMVSILVYLLMYFSYCDAFAMAGWLSYPLSFFIAVLLCPVHRRALEESGAGHGA